MRRYQKRKIFCGCISVLLGLSMLFLLPVFPIRAEAAGTEEFPVVSYGLNVLSAGTDVALSAPVGNDIVFSADAFARGMNLSSVRYLTVRSLPPVTDGELLLGSTRVAAGQTISGENLSYLTFSASADDMRHSSFSFSVNGSATATVCNLYFLSSVNYTPTVSLASGLSLNLSTYRDVQVSGRLSAYDPDGDDLIFEIVTYPKNGTVRFRDRELGTYTYTPADGFDGKDSFSYVARDRYGNYSAMATVRLEVNVSGSAVVYADLTGSGAESAAMLLTDRGIMSGKQVGNAYYFEPEEGVRRVEFLVMAMNAAGMTDVPAVADTGFADDAAIPDGMKGYVSAAYRLGYISGTVSGGRLCFLPDEEITRAQAAVILNQLIGGGTVSVTPVFSDSSEIPAWAREAVYSLSAAGILTSRDGTITPTAKLTRAQAAEMLAAELQYLHK